MPRRDVLLMKSREFGWAELASVLETMDGVRLVGEAASPHHGLDLAATLHPDVILAAARIGGTALPPVLLALQRGPCPTAKILFSTGVDREAIAATAGLRYDGWLLWPELSAEGLPHVLGALLFGDARLGSPSLVDGLMAGGHAPESAGLAPAGQPVRLSRRERAVLGFLALEDEAELTLAEIAHRLGLKTSSVATYVDRLGTKLDVQRGGRRAVVGADRRRGLIA